MNSMEPTSSATGAGIATWKVIGGLAGIGAIGAGLAAVVVMCLMKPRTNSEWTVGIICTVIGSICGGAAFIQYFELQHWANSLFGLVAMLGLVFACGLPAWALVRWTFNYIDERQGHDLVDIYNELRGKSDA